MRCANKNCRIKLTKDNKHVYSVYCQNDLENKQFGEIRRPVKIFICEECAKMYSGKYYKEDNKFSAFIEDVEFVEEFIQDIVLKKLKC